MDRGDYDYDEENTTSDSSVDRSRQHRKPDKKDKSLEKSQLI